MENCGSIAKLGGLPQNLPMAINCEYGAFDNDRCVLPRTVYDKKIDKESPRPGEQKAAYDRTGAVAPTHRAGGAIQGELGRAGSQAVVAGAGDRCSPGVRHRCRRRSGRPRTDGDIRAVA